MKRMKKSFRFVVSLLLIFTLLVPELAPVFAADWNGGSADSNVGNVSGSSGGFAVMSGFAVTSGSIPFVALRFSYYNVNTKTTKGTTVDIFRSEYTAQMGWNKFSSKYNKPQLIELYKNWDWTTFKTKGFTTGNAHCYAENDSWLGITSFPDYTNQIETWQNTDDYINAILKTMSISGVSSIDDFGYGDYLLVEPMFPVQLKGNWYVLTLTEMAILGTHADFNGVGSSGSF